MRQLSLLLAVLSSACASTGLEVSIPRPIPSAVDTTAFSRVLLAGFFTSGGSGEIDLSDETVRILRSSLRNHSPFVVTDADVLPADRETGVAARRSTTETFADEAFWRGVGAEYGQPLIVTGTVFVSHQLRFAIDSSNGGSLQPLPTGERGALMLRPTFVFIDGRSGATLYTETVREQVSYDETEQVSRLSLYFVAMDRLVPRFLQMITTQTVATSRVLLQ